jgi:hypothetical protein
MTPRKPPALAQALLEQVDPGNEALHGDLLEEFAAGRSRLWYWRQVLAAAGVAAIRPVRTDGIAGLEPAVLGVTMLVLLGFYVVFVVNVTAWLLRVEGVEIIRRMPALLTDWLAAMPLLALLAGAVLGRIIGRGADHHRIVRIVAFGAATMGCAVATLQIVTGVVPSLFMPDLYQQVGTTALFIAGLIGSIGATIMGSPRRLPLALAMFLALPLLNP